MPHADPAPQQVHLEQVGPLARQLVAALAKGGIPEAGRVDVLTAHVTACCQRCGTSLSALDLLRLGLAAQPESLGDGRLTRVLRGYCISGSCESYYYLFTFREHPSVAWPALQAGAKAEPGKAQLDPAAQARLALRRSEKWRERRGAALRVTAGLLVLALLLLWRQWQAGGRIPVLREPRQFTVAPQPQAPVEAAVPGQPTPTLNGTPAAVAPGNAMNDPELPDLTKIKPDPDPKKKK